MPWASPGARMIVGGGTSRAARRCVARRFGTAYITRLHLACSVYCLPGCVGKIVGIAVVAQSRVLARPVTTQRRRDPR